MTSDLTDRQQALVDLLPTEQSLQELGNELGLTKTGVESRIHRVREKDGHDIQHDGSEWSYEGPHDADTADDADSTLPDLSGVDVGDDPSPDALTDREEYIVRELQTGTTVDELAADLEERASVITQHLRDIKREGWQVYIDGSAEQVSIEGEHTLRSSEHKGTRTRKANRWWELRHNELVKQWKGIGTPDVSLSATAGNEDWVTHMTDLHAGDLVRGYDDSVVHETEDLPPIIDHITDRSLALSQKHGSEYDTAYLLWGGDFITNEGIYEGQHENLDAWLDEQVDTLHGPLLRQIKTFSREFDNVVVVGQAGNHGDIRADGSSKQANADLLLYKSIRNTVGELAEVGFCENVAFNIGRAGSPTPFWIRDGEIHGQLRHGQDRKPQAETSARKKEWLSTVIDSLNFGQAVDIIWMGHYHVSGRIPWNGPPIFVTASPLPVGEYPRKLGEVDGLNEPDIATCHGVSDDGVTGVYPIDPRNFEPSEYINATAE
jgi:DNA-binding CsgD family transcriptional regulator